MYVYCCPSSTGNTLSPEKRKEKRRISKLDFARRELETDVRYFR
jgi:hypothetical protein